MAPKTKTLAADVVAAPSRFAFGESVVVLGKSAHSATVNIDDLPDHVRVYLMAYGLKQCLNDAAAGGKSHEEKVALFDKRLANLREGTLRAQRTAAVPGVDARVLKHARDIAATFAKSRGLTGDKLKEWVAMAIQNDQVLAMARKRVADEDEALGGLEVDLGA